MSLEVEIELEIEVEGFLRFNFFTTHYPLPTVFCVRDSSGILFCCASTSSA